MASTKPQPHTYISVFFSLSGEFLSEEEKKKMSYYYGGKEKSAEEVKKGSQGEIAPYFTWDLQQDFNRMMNRFERDFEDFWGTSSRIGRDMTRRARGQLSPFSRAMMPSVDIEIKKKLRLKWIFGFQKEDVQVELEEDEIIINVTLTG